MKISASMRAALIGAVAVIVAAIIGAIIPLVWPSLFRKSTLEIDKFDPISRTAHGRPQFELLVSNHSSQAVVATSADISLVWDSGLNALVPTSTYVIDASLDGDSSGSISGKVNERGTGIAHPLSGHLNLRRNVSWDLELSVPLAESIEPDKGDRVIIIFPETMSLRKGETVNALRSFGGSADQLDVKSLLQSANRVSVRIAVTYDGNRIAQYYRPWM
jgi:hypothetical protein